MTIDLAIAEIRVAARRRRRNPEKVRDLAESIRELGLLNPVTVREDRSLVAGLHRVEAGKLLGWETIPATVVSLDDTAAELAEIDENLIRNELTVLERCEHLKRRKRIYEDRHPETKRGGDRKSKAARSKRNHFALIPAFGQDTATKIGATPRTVQQEVQIAARLPDDVQDSIRDCTVADSKTDLLRLARKPEDEQREVAAKIAAGAGTVKEAEKAIRADRRQAEKERGAELAATAFDDRLQLHCCAVDELIKHVEPQSVDVIITDPPYEKASVSAYRDLSRFAAHALKLSGSLLVMSGQYWLPAVMVELEEHLRYHWTLAYLTPGGENVQMWSRKLNTGWKPVLWYVRAVRGDYVQEPKDWHGDVIRSIVTPSIKEHHEWGQTESGIAALVEGWSKPGDLVCDPFLGGGTTALTALKGGRRFVGADLDPEALATTQARLREALP